MTDVTYSWYNEAQIGIDKNFRTEVCAKKYRHLRTESRGYEKMEYKGMDISVTNTFLTPAYNRNNTHADASASWYTPQSGVDVTKPKLTDATTAPKEMIWAALEGGTAGKVDGFKCLPARPIKIGKAITFGIQA